MEFDDKRNIRYEPHRLTRIRVVFRSFQHIETLFGVTTREDRTDIVGEVMPVNSLHPMRHDTILNRRSSPFAAAREDLDLMAALLQHLRRLAHISGDAPVCGIGGIFVTDQRDMEWSCRFLYHT